MCHHASDLLKEFHDVHKKVPCVVVRIGDTRWKTPTSSIYKINFDGALLRSRHV